MKPEVLEAINYIEEQSPLPHKHHFVNKDGKAVCSCGETLGGEHVHIFKAVVASPAGEPVYFGRCSCGEVDY